MNEQQLLEWAKTNRLTFEQLDEVEQEFIQKHSKDALYWNTTLEEWDECGFESSCDEFAVYRLPEDFELPVQPDLGNTCLNKPHSEDPEQFHRHIRKYQEELAGYRELLEECIEELEAEPTNLTKWQEKLLLEVSGHGVRIEKLEAWQKADAEQRAKIYKMLRGE